MSPSDASPSDARVGNRYFVGKASRDSTRPYDGPSLVAAGLTSRWYATREEAESDAVKLAAVNRVGWVVRRWNATNEPAVE